MFDRAILREFDGSPLSKLRSALTCRRVARAGVVDHAEGTWTSKGGFATYDSTDNRVRLRNSVRDQVSWIMRQKADERTCGFRPVEVYALYISLRPKPICPIMRLEDLACSKSYQSADHTNRHRNDEFPAIDRYQGRHQWQVHHQHRDGTIKPPPPTPTGLLSALRDIVRGSLLRLHSPLWYGV